MSRVWRTVSRRGWGMPTRWWLVVGLACSVAPGEGLRAQEALRIQQAQALRPQAPTAVEVADSLASAGRMEEAFALLSARLDVAPGDPEALVLATRAALGLGMVGTSAPVRLYWLRTADTMGQRLLDARPDDVDAVAWAAAARGRVAIAEDGARTVVRLAEDVWRLTGQVLERDPGHPLANHVRGKLHQEAMKLSSMRRFLARVLLGFDMAGKVSWELAEEHMRKAQSGDPGMILFYVDLGDTYRYQGKRELALETYRAGLARPDRLPVDEHLKGLLRRRIQRLEEGPGR